MIRYYLNKPVFNCKRNFIYVRKWMMLYFRQKKHLSTTLKVQNFAIGLI